MHIQVIICNEWSSIVQPSSMLSPPLPLSGSLSSTLMVKGYSWSQPMYASHMKYRVYLCTPGAGAVNSSFSLECV